VLRETDDMSVHPLRHCLVLLLLLALGPVSLQAVVFSELKPMVTISFSSHERVLQRASLGFQGLGFQEGYEMFREQFERLLLIPSLTGIDPYKPCHFFLLTADPPEAIPTPALILPLTDRNGAEILESLKGQYGEIAQKSGVTSFSDPNNPESTFLISVAIAEGHALISSRIDGVRWLALQRRDRKLPEAGLIESPLRVTANGDLLGLFLQLIAVLNPTAQPEKTATLQNFSLHLREIGLVCAAFDTVDLGLDAGVRDFSLTLRLNANTNSPMARQIASLQTPDAKFARLLPAPALNSEISSLPGLLPALPSSTTDWLEDLAESTQFLGLRMAPRNRGWLKLLLPVLNGNYASATLKAPTGMGICSIQIFGLPNARKAQAAFSILEQLLPSPQNPLPQMNPLPLRNSNGLRITGYLFGEQSMTNSTYAGGMGGVLTQLLRLNNVEMTSRDDHLIIVRGAPQTLDDLLKPGAPGKQPPTILELAEREFAPLRPSETVLGAGQVAAIATLRAMAAVLPSIGENISQLPLPGDDLIWRATREGASITWQLALPSNELTACGRLRMLDTEVLHELLSQFVLEQFNRAATKTGQKEFIDEQMRRIRTPNAP
jgi:hypothetical protein